MSETDLAGTTSTAGVDRETSDGTTVHFTTDPIDDSDVFDQHI